MGFHPLAEASNALIRKGSPVLLDLLSTRGKALYFPRKGILGQGADARGTRLNATIGIALEDGGQPMGLPSLTKGMPLSPGDFLPYAPSEGLRELRVAWAAKAKRASASPFSCSLPVVTAGITHALSVAASLFVDPGEGVILFDPSWDNYALLFETMYGGRLRPVPLFDGGALHTAGLAEALGRGREKRIVLLNFPHNPTGYSPALAEAETIVSVLREYAEGGGSLVVLLDDAYEGFVYEDGIVGSSLFSRLASLHERIIAVKIDGASKEEYAWGLRVGFVTFGGKGIAPDGLQALEEKAAGAVRATVSNASHLSQRLLLNALSASELAKEQRNNFETLRGRYRAAKSLFGAGESQKNYTLLPCNSGYFLCLKLRDGLDAERVRTELRTAHSVGVIALPGNLLRIAFSSVAEGDMAALAEAVGAACETAGS